MCVCVCVCHVCVCACVCVCVYVWTCHIKAIMSLRTNNYPYTHTSHPHVIHMSSTSHPHLIHISSTSHPHHIHISSTSHPHLIHISSTSPADSTLFQTIKKGIQPPPCSLNFINISYTCHHHHHLDILRVIFELKFLSQWSLSYKLCHNMIIMWW